MRQIVSAFDGCGWFERRGMLDASEIRMQHTLRRLVPGMVGGLAGLAAMRLVQRLVAPLVRQRAPRPTDIFASDRSISLIGPQHNPDESATDALARIAYEKIVGHKPSNDRKQTLSRLVHIGYGLGVAMLYRAVKRDARLAGSLRSGMLLGLALWAFGDELAVPLLGLADKPTAYHFTNHLQSLAAHVGYGVATATTTRALGGLT